MGPRGVRHKEFVSIAIALNVYAKQPIQPLPATHISFLSGSPLSVNGSTRQTILKNFEMGCPSPAFIMAKIGKAMRVNGAIFENNVPFYLMNFISYNEYYHVTFMLKLLINHKEKHYYFFFSFCVGSVRFNHCLFFLWFK